jgi:hypothetical protein
MAEITSTVWQMGKGRQHHAKVITLGTATFAGQFEFEFIYIP